MKLLNLCLGFALALTVAPVVEASKPGTLVDKVRQATAHYRDVNVAIADGYEGGPCVSGPNEGAMGVHFVKGSLLGDGALDATTPEVLVYEPQPNGRLRLVGVEFITFAEVWDAANGPGAALEGHLLHYVGSPNRYGIPAFYQLHVWAWKHNPRGTFSDWSPNVSCDYFTMGGAGHSH
jgi:hypothetical protein